MRILTSLQDLVNEVCITCRERTFLEVGENFALLMDH